MEIKSTKGYTLERYMALYQLRHEQNVHIWDGEKYQEKLVDNDFIIDLDDHFSIIPLSLHVGVKYYHKCIKYLTEALTASKQVRLFSFSVTPDEIIIRLLLDSDSVFAIQNLLNISPTNGHMYEDEASYLILKFLLGSKVRDYSAYDVIKGYNSKKRKLLADKEKEDLVSKIKKLNKKYKGWELEYRIYLLLPYGYYFIDDPIDLYEEDKITDIWKIVPGVYIWTNINKKTKEA